MEAQEGTVEAVRPEGCSGWTLAFPWRRNIIMFSGLDEVRRKMRHEIVKRDTYQPPPS